MLLIRREATQASCGGHRREAEVASSIDLHNILDFLRRRRSIVAGIRPSPGSPQRLRGLRIGPQKGKPRARGDRDATAAQIRQRIAMRAHEIGHVNVVSDAGAVRLSGSRCHRHPLLAVGRARFPPRP